MKRQSLELVGEGFILHFTGIEEHEGTAEFSHAGPADAQSLPCRHWSGTLRIEQVAGKRRETIRSTRFETIKFWTGQIPDLEFEQVILLFLQGHGRYCVPKVRSGKMRKLHDHLAQKILLETPVEGLIVVNPLCMYLPGNSILEDGIIASLLGVPGSQEIPVPEEV